MCERVIKFEIHFPDFFEMEEELPKLEKCPFCHCDGSFYFHTESEDVSAACSDDDECIGSQIKYCHFDDVESAAHQWNLRHSDRFYPISMIDIRSCKTWEVAEKLNQVIARLNVVQFKVE